MIGRTCIMRKLEKTNFTKGKKYWRAMITHVLNRHDSEEKQRIAVLEKIGTKRTHK